MKKEEFVWFVLAFLICVMISICNDMRQVNTAPKLDCQPVEVGQSGVCK